MPKFTPNSELRNTTLPTELQMIKNTLQGKERDGKSNWHHESAGNVAFKRFIQKNREIYPELSNEPRSPTTLSKISAPEDRKSKGFKRDESQQKLKKMCSLEAF
jgi:murein tripeptide amidase MpaA